MTIKFKTCHKMLKLLISTAWRPLDTKKQSKTFPLHIKKIIS